MTGPTAAYLDAVRRAARSLGLERDVGTVVVPEPDRAGTGSATSYAAPGLTIVFADPALRLRLSDIEGAQPLSTDAFVDAAIAGGAELVGIGHQRVLEGHLVEPAARAQGLTFRVLDADAATDRARLAELVDACHPDEVDEADIDLDEPDPTITAFVAADGRIAAYGSARPWDVDPRFDDIGVLTHPEFRGRRLGALVVHEFIRHRAGTAPDALPLYRCNRDNVGSNRTAESLGFTLVQRIGAVRFPT